MKEEEKYKWCNYCQLMKQHKEFWRNRTAKSKDGRRYMCIECCKQYRLDNVEKYKASVRRWSKNNPLKIKENNLRYRLAHPDRMAAATRRWRSKHPDFVKAKEYSYYWNNREKCLAATRKWKAENIVAIREKDRINAQRKRDEAKRKRNEANKILQGVFKMP